VLSVPESTTRPDYAEVFMPPGDVEAARRLTVVWLEPPNAFADPSRAITAALFDTYPHL
jgi:hypothetical protein